MKCIKSNIIDTNGRTECKVLVRRPEQNFHPMTRLQFLCSQEVPQVPAVASKGGGTHVLCYDEKYWERTDLQCRMQRPPELESLYQISRLDILTLLFALYYARPEQTQWSAAPQVPAVASK